MIDRKTVNFNDNEQDIYNYVLQITLNDNKKFATYVKELIKQDMNKESLDQKIQKKIEEYMKCFKETWEASGIPDMYTEETRFDSEDIEELKGFMKR